MKHFYRLEFARLLIAVCALQSRASAQNDVQTPLYAVAKEAVACPTAKQIKPAQIYGLWRARFNPAPAGLPANATMRLERHAEFGDSVAGFVSRELGAAADTPTDTPAIAGHAAKAQLAGDLEHGLLTLDESSNGISITGTWNGEMAEGSCGKKVTGMWKDTSNSAAPNTADVPFTLEKLPGW